MQAANPQLWAQVKTIAADALELPMQDRERFVREKCGADTATLSAVLELLGFAETIKPADLPGQPRFGRFSGRKIGPYQIHWPLGAGGVGEVYLATRTDNVSMRVAMKFLRPDCTHPGLVRRFQREAQILAALDHPNIVRLLDAGETEDGQPWFVMEHVEGRPIDVHCREHRLPIEKRLTLFHDACIAVQYAHVHLLVHRDIKPGNILVTSDGTLKLLDFGIARLLRPELFAAADTAPTAVWDQPLTPSYASPEQLTGSPVTTAADIYSLGVVLFELVTGSVPFLPAKDSTWQDFVQTVREQEPQRPSTVVSKTASAVSASDNATLARRLRGDIDNIILKALEKSPQDRYLTAQEMADDIFRYQHGLPVHAHPDTAGYRTSKFIRRNIPALGAVAAVLISLAAGLATTLRQKAIADRNLAQVRDVSRRAMATYDQVQQACLPAIPATLAVNKTEAALAASPGSESLEDQLATNYAALADTLRSDGQQTQAAQAAQKVIDLRTRIAQERPQDLQAQSNLRTALQRYSASSTGTLGFASASAPGQLSKSAAATPELALGYLQLGDVLRLSGDRSSASQAYRSSLALFEDLLQTNPSPQTREGAEHARAALRRLAAK